MPQRKACATCEGRGHSKSNPFEKCCDCSGTGILEQRCSQCWRWKRVAHFIGALKNGKASVKANCTECGLTADVRKREETQAWAARSYKRYGERAVAIAESSRLQGLRDLVIPVGDIAECIPVISKRMPLKPKCQHGGMYDRAGAKTRPCGADAVLLSITDSGLELFFCEEHADERVVRVPG